MENWSIWLVIAFFLAILELFLPGLTLICLSIGAFAGAAGAYGGTSLSVQLFAFIVASLIAFARIGPSLSSLFSSSESPESNVHALIGKEALVSQKIRGTTERGWVKVQGEDWPAMTTPGDTLVEGNEVMVKGIEGNTLIVEGAL